MTGDTSAEILTAYLTSRNPDDVQLDRVAGMSPVEVRMLARASNR